MKQANRRALAIMAMLPALLLTGCLGGQRLPDGEEHMLDGDGMVRTYRSVTQEEAMRMMEEEKDYIILDVRRQDEFEQAHIPGAICVPNETIGTEPPAELPDLSQRVFVYCRSGRRSKEASQKLLEMGYTGVVEFGGILTWPGETVSGAE